MRRMLALATVVMASMVVTLPAAPAHATGEPGDGTPCVEGNELPTYRDVVYGQAPQGVDLELDVWLPPGGPGPFPSLLLLHGAFGHGDKIAYDGWAEEICFQGFVVFNVNYRVQCTQDEPPPNPFLDYEMCQGAVAPDQLDDVTQAMLWVRAHAGDYAGDPTRVGVWGGSGGGTLSSMMGVFNTGDAKPEVVVTWSGMVKLWVFKGSSDPDRIYESTIRYVGCDFEGENACPVKWVDQSAVSWVTADDPPFYIANGTGETIPLLQAKSLHQKLANRDVTHVYQPIPEPLHARQYQNFKLDSGLTVQQDTIAFVHEILGY
jgi:acetyl esterase/lipase